jgi:long-chain acyl-CoA synthetase
MTSDTGTAVSALTGPPLEVLGELLHGPRIDHLLTRAATTAGEREALRTPESAISYAELDADTDALAAALRQRLGRAGVTVAMAMELSPAYALGFFGITRSGNTAALVNPLLPPDRLAHVLRLSGAEAAILPVAAYRRIEPLLGTLPALRLVVTTQEEAGLPSLAELVREGRGRSPFESTMDSDAVACLQFTSGTTGPAKAVRLTHRNLLVNAAQTAYGHRLDATSVLFNHLPAFHIMHLTIGTAVAATHVLCAEPDAAEAVRVAARAGATHFYSLPARFAKLAGDPALSSLRIPSLRAMLSGGSALSPSAAEVLSGQFGVPVAQGFGMAETSPITHLADLREGAVVPRGSAGIPVPGAQARIVDLETGAVVPIGETGELQLRGPQLMKGYLGRQPGEDLTADGWLPTGDVARFAASGDLFVVDRIKDLFKRDNEIVSPALVEEVLREHPAVADCVVFDHPHPLSGAVAHALVVARAPADEAEVAAFVNARVAGHERIEHLQFVTAIPRSPTGKVRRSELREQYAAAEKS